MAFGMCATYDLESNDWEPQSNCSYIDVSGPYMSWDAASVYMPDRDEIYLFGGRQTSPDSKCATVFAESDENWSLHLDTLGWERLAGDPMFWGLPQLSGERHMQRI